MLAMDAGSWVQFAFNGTGARWIGYKDEWSGIARVYVDGALKATVDTAGSGQAKQVLYSIDGLAAGNHTLKVEVTGSIGPASSSAWVWVDAFEAVAGTTGRHRWDRRHRRDRRDPAGFGHRLDPHPAERRTDLQRRLVRQRELGAQRRQRVARDAQRRLGGVQVHRPSGAVDRQPRRVGRHRAGLHRRCAGQEGRHLLRDRRRTAGPLLGRRPGGEAAHAAHLRHRQEEQESAGSWVWIDAFDIKQ